MSGQAMAEEWLAVIHDRAEFMLSVGSAIEGITWSEHDSYVIAAGVEAGISATLLVLQELGLLPGGKS